MAEVPKLAVTTPQPSGNQLHPLKGVAACSDVAMIPLALHHNSEKRLFMYPPEDARGPCFSLFLRMWLWPTSWWKLEENRDQHDHEMKPFWSMGKPTEGTASPIPSRLLVLSMLVKPLFPLARKTMLSLFLQQWLDHRNTVATATLQ